MSAPAPTSSLAAGRGMVILTGTTLAASFLAQALLGRRLGPHGLGEYYATTLFVTVLTVVSLLGLPVACSRRVAAAAATDAPSVRRAAETAFAVAIATGLLAGIVGAIAWPTAARLLNLGSPPDRWLLAAAVSANVLLSFASAVLLGQLRMLHLTLLVVAQPVAVLVAVIGIRFGLQLDGPELAAIGFVAGGLAAIVAFLASALRPWMHSGEWRALRRGTVSGASVVYTTVVASWIDRAIVGLVAGPAPLGAFAAASTFPEAALRVPRNLGALGVPVYARLAEDRSTAANALDTNVRLLVTFFLVAGCTLIAAGGDLLTIVFGPGFHYAGNTTRLLAMSLVPIGIVLALTSGAVGMGHQRRPALISLALLGLQVSLGIVGTLLFSIAGAALAQLIVWSMAAFLHLRAWATDHGGIIAAAVIRTIGVAPASWMVAWLLAGLPVWWPLRAAVAAAFAFTVCAIFLIRAPERRVATEIWRRRT